MKQFPPFRLDVVNQCLSRQTDAGDPQDVRLAPKAFDLLRYLVDHAGRLAMHGEIISALWPKMRVEPQVVKQHVFEIRKALGDPPKRPRFIETHPRRGYRFIAEVSDAVPLVNGFATVRPPTGPLVGREGMLKQLRECLHRAMQGQRQIVFITGEPGIGKTALIDEFQRQGMAEVNTLRIGRGQCIEGYGGQEAYYPMLEALAQLCHGKSGDALVQTLAAPAPTWLVQFPTLISREHRETLRSEIIGGTRARMLREISEALEVITAEIPLLLVFEDLQWADRATVDLVSVLARRRAPGKLMLVATQRTEGVERDDDPLNSVKRELLVHGLCREIHLDPLEESDISEYLAAQSAARHSPEGLSAIVHRHSDGNPLFMIAALEHMTRRGLIARQAGRWELRVPLETIDIAVPDNLVQMIEARIERLSQQERRVLEAASITGTGFSPAVNAAGMDLGFDAFEELCENLSRRQNVIHAKGVQAYPNAIFSSRYEFVHAMYREVLYRRQPAGRRATLHRRIGQRLEELFAERVDEVAVELAHHFEHGHDYARAAKYQQLAAQADARRDAHRDATMRLQYAIELLGRLPRKPSPRDGELADDRPVAGPTQGQSAHT